MKEILVKVYTSIYELEQIEKVIKKIENIEKEYSCDCTLIEVEIRTVT